MEINVVKGNEIPVFRVFCVIFISWVGYQGFCILKATWTLEMVLNLAGFYWGKKKRDYLEATKY